MQFKEAVAQSVLLLVSLLAIVAPECRADEFADFVNPLVAKHYLKCHGGEKVNGDVSFKSITTAAQFLALPALINKMIDAVDSNDMPPEGEPSHSTRKLTCVYWPH